MGKTGWGAENGGGECYICALVVQNDVIHAPEKASKKEGGREAPYPFHALANPAHQLTLSDFLDHAIPALAGEDLSVLDDAPVELEDGGGGGRGGNRGGWRHGYMGRGRTGLALACCCVRGSGLTRGGWGGFWQQTLARPVCGCMRNRGWR